MRQLRKYKNCSLLVVGARNRAEVVGRFLIRQRRIESFFSREKREKIFSLCPHQTFGR